MTRGSESEKRRPVRWAGDSRETVGYPIVPMGKAVQGGVGSGGREVAYSALNWRIILPDMRDRKAPSSTVLDVYVALLHLLAKQDFPDDGTVQFSRYDFLKLIGWTTRSGKPSGRHYSDLDGSLDYLMATRFAGPDGRVHRPPRGRLFRGKQRLQVLSHYWLADEAFAQKVPAATTLSGVTFSSEFMELLRGGEGSSRLDFDLYLSLSSGTPRQLLRVLVWMRQEGVDSLPMGQLFQRVGSTQRYFSPSRADQLLNRAHRELRERGVLSAVPEYTKNDSGEWWVAYEMGDPGTLQAREDVLVWQAEAYGVQPSVARSLAVQSPAHLERVLAATTLGLLRPTKTLPAMIVAYVRDGFDVHGFGVRYKGEPPESADSLAVQYLRWAALERDVRIRYRGVHPAGYRERIAHRVVSLGDVTDEWVLDGLVDMYLNHELRVETFAEFRAGRPDRAYVGRGRG